MQVSNNTQPCNFGMALKIKPNVRKAIRMKSPEKYEALQKAEALVNGTKYYDLVVDDNGMSRIVSDSDEFFGLNNITKPFENSNYFFVDTFTKGRPCNRCIICLNNEAAQKAYEQLTKATPGYEREAILTKILDENKR